MGADVRLLETTPYGQLPTSPALVSLHPTLPSLGLYFPDLHVLRGVAYHLTV